MSEENTSEEEFTLSSFEAAIVKGDDLYGDYVDNREKFIRKGTASAAARARKNLSALAKHIKTVRKELQLEKVRVVAEKRASKAVVA